MEIELLSPENGCTIEIVPTKQEQIIKNLPKNHSEGENEFDWYAPEISDSDNSHPRHTVFTWGFSGSMANVAAAFLFLSDNEKFDNAEKIEIFGGESFMPITNFKRNSTYYWKITAYSYNGDVICESKVYSFKTSDAMPQWYHIDGTTNVRDIGGIKCKGGSIKSGMVIRGAETDTDFEVSTQGLEFLKNTLKIKTELDLRKSTNGSKKQSSFAKKYINISIKGYAEAMTDEEKPKIRQIFKVFADAKNYPIYLHCLAGADRTGTVIMILEALLGAEAEEISEDFEYTSLSCFGVRSRYNKPFRDVIEELEKYGNTPDSAAGEFLLSCGITNAEIDSIKKILLVK